MSYMDIKNLLTEGVKETMAIEFLSQEVKNSQWKGKIFIAGGAVRDELLGLDLKDIDLVIEFPNGGIEFANWLCKKLGIYSSSNPVVYPRFGTAKFNLRGIKHNGVDLSSIDVECVMSRTEVYDGKTRKPEVGFGTIAQDAERRDFTVNSLMKDLSSGEIIDLTGKGKADIQKGIIRSAIDPNIIFKEDPLRMLRAIRFAVKYNWVLPLYMIKALKANAHTLKNISAERIQDELNKMLVTGSPDTAIRLLQMTDLNKYVAPELDLLIGLKQNKYHKWDANKHTLEVLKGVPSDIRTRLAALFHDIGKWETKTVVDNAVHFYNHEEVGERIARDIMTRLKYPNSMIDSVCSGVRNHMRLKNAGSEGEIISDKALRKLQADMGENLEMTLDLMHSDNTAHADAHAMPNQIPGVKNRLANLKPMNPKKDLPINGNDIMKSLNIKPGPMIKVLLAAVEDATFENPHLSKNDALNIVKKEYNLLPR